MIAKRNGNVALLGKRQTAVRLRHLVHDDGQLGEDLDANHAVLDGSLQKLLDVFHNIPEDVFLFVQFVPAVFGDLGQERDQRLDDEALQVHAGGQIVEDVVSV